MFRRDRVDEVPEGTVRPGEEILPGYDAIALLAHGKRMDTYDAWSHVRGCRVVVKVLRADRMGEKRVRAAALLEGRLLRELTHPHLLRGYEVHAEPRPAMVLETLSGATLEALVDDEPLSIPDVAEIGIQVGSALGYLHHSGWLHLDVKPANVIIEAGRAVLIDLSLVDTPGSGRPGAGTRGYLAPEQARGEGLSPATDVWGLGITLLEALTGEMPYGDEATWDSRPRVPIVHRRSPLPPRRIPDLPEDLDAVLRASIALVPQQRPTLAQVQDVLGRHTSLAGGA